MSASRTGPAFARIGLVAGLAGLGLLAPAGPASACDSASCSLLTRNANGLVPKKKFRLDLTFGYTDQGRRLQGSEEVEGVYRPLINLETGTVLPAFHRDIDGYDQVVQADVSYGLSRSVNLVGSIPLATWHAHDVAHGSLVQEYGTVGLGDTLLGVRAGLGPRGLVGGLSLKLPTGNYKIQGEFGGGIQDPTLQPGTGAWDVVGLLQYSWPTSFLDLRWSAAASYQATTTNSLDYRFGNQTIVVAGASRGVWQGLSASLQLKLYHQDRNLFQGQGVASTGSTSFYVTPGLRVAAPHGLSVYGYLLLVPYTHVNETQLAPSVAFVTGISKLF